MALIAGGRANEVAGHPERDGPGANNAVVTAARGHPVQRSYLVSTVIGFSPVAAIGSPRWRTCFLPAGGHRMSPARRRRGALPVGRGGAAMTRWARVR